MDEKQARLLRKVYSEIVRGHSSFKIKDQTIYIKHLDLVSQSPIDEVYDKHYNKAIEKGVPSLKDRLNFLNEQEQWTNEDESKMKDAEAFIRGLKASKKNLYLKSQLDSQNQLIEEEEKKYFAKFSEKHGLVGTVAENYANKKLNEAYLLYSTYKDDACSRLYFSEEEYDDLDMKDFALVESGYQQCLSKFNEQNLKKVALASFFQNIYMLAGDSMIDFFGKAAAQLTFYQVELLSYGSFFKAILSGQHKPPEELMDDPDKLIDWYTSSGNLRKMLDNTKKEGGATTIVGAKKADLEALGIGQNETVSLHKEMKKKGKGLNMQDMMKIHGV